MQGSAATPDVTSTEPTTSSGFPGGGQDLAYLTRVEAGRHPDFDRVVWEFDGPPPSFRVEYADGRVTELGSGRTVGVDGGAALTIVLSPASGVDLSGEQPVEVYTGPHRLSGADAGTRVVTEVVETGDFEATFAWAVGVDDVRPFMITTLPSPSRIVLDVSH